MGIYIPNMEMPTSCYACMFFTQTDHWNKEDEADILSYCKRTGEKTWESVNGYLPNCPLVSIPTPHGDLIDRDEARGSIKPWSPEDERNGCTFDTVKKLMHTMLDRAPTIIPASEEDK